MMVDSTATVRDVFDVLLRRKTLVVSGTVAVAILFALYAFLASPIYRATTVLMPVTAERGAGGVGGALGQLGGLASLAGINLGSQNSTFEESIAVLHSQGFAQQFISDRNLVPLFFPKHWDVAAKKWTVPENERPTLSKAFRYFSEKVFAVSVDKKTGLVTLTIDWKDRQQAAEWANDLVARVNREMRGRAIESAEASTAYLDKELAGTQLVEMRDAINRLVEAQVKQRMLATVTQQYAFRVVDRALVPDADDILKPRKASMIITGVLFGFFLSCFAAIGLGSLAGELEPTSKRA